MQAEYKNAVSAINMKDSIRQVTTEKNKRIFIKNAANLLDRRILVGMTGFEPATSWSQTKRATNCATSR